MPRRAFTLIELIIVCVVISALAAIIAPAFFMAQHQAKKVTCVSNLRQLGLALQLYQQDNGAYAPQGWEATSQNLEDGGPADPLQPYTKGTDLYHCPETQRLSYNWRGALEMDLGGPYRLFASAPSSVITYCPHTVSSNAQAGDYLVLREDGSVSRVPAAQVRYWIYRSGRWLPPGTPAQSDYEATAAVFPNEPWPPAFAGP